MIYDETIVDATFDNLVKHAQADLSGMLESAMSTYKGLDPRVQRGLTGALAGGLTGALGSKAFGGSALSGAFVGAELGGVGNAFRPELMKQVRRLADRPKRPPAMPKLGQEAPATSPLPDMAGMLHKAIAKYKQMDPGARSLTGAGIGALGMGLHGAATARPGESRLTRGLTRGLAGGAVGAAIPLATGLASGTTAAQPKGVFWDADRVGDTAAAGLGAGGVYAAHKLLPGLSAKDIQKLTAPLASGGDKGKAVADAFQARAAKIRQQPTRSGPFARTRDLMDLIKGKDVELNGIRGGARTGGRAALTSNNLLGRLGALGRAAKPASYLVPAGLAAGYSLMD